MAQSNRRTRRCSNRMPPGIPYIVGNEGAERFSFYGMKAILKIYLIALFVQFVDESHGVPGDRWPRPTARSTEIVHLFVAGVYAFPLIGAIIADRLLGKYRTILWVSLIYCAGHAVLAVAGRLGAMSEFDAAELSMYLGLGLIAIGSGGIKPCVSANVGDQFTVRQRAPGDQGLPGLLFHHQLRLVLLDDADAAVVALVRRRSGFWRAGRADGHRHARILDGTPQVRPRAAEPWRQARAVRHAGDDAVVHAAVFADRRLLRAVGTLPGGGAGSGREGGREFCAASRGRWSASYFAALLVAAGWRRSRPWCWALAVSRAAEASQPATASCRCCSTT